MKLSREQKHIHGFCAVCKRDRWLNIDNRCRECHKAEQSRSVNPFNQTVWTTEEVPLREGLAIMTDDWIEGDNYSQLTVQTLRDALLAFVASTRPPLPENRERDSVHTPSGEAKDFSATKGAQPTKEE